MYAGASIALTILRVPRGATRPSEETFRQALDGDRAALGLTAADGGAQLVITGPYRILAGGRELDEYVVWES